MITIKYYNTVVQASKGLERPLLHCGYCSLPGREYSASSVRPNFKSRPAAGPRRWTADVDSDRSLNCAGVVAKESVLGNH